MDLGRNCKTFYLENGLARSCRLLVDLELYRTSYHHVGEFLLVGILGINGADVFTLTQYRNSVGYSHDLV